MAGPQFEVEVGPLARSQIRGAARWYRGKNPTAAKRFVAAVRRAIQVLASGALLWREFEAGFRRVHVEGFPYMLVYMVEGELVTVVGVQPMRRRPDAWRGSDEDEGRE